MSDGFSGTQAASVVGITYRQLDYWARTDLIRPSLSDAAGSGSRRRYSYKDLLELRVANGLGGRSYVSVTGEVSDVRSSVLAGSKSAEGTGMLLRQVVVPRPHPDLVRHL